MKFTDHDIEEMFQGLDAKAPVAFKDAYWTEMEQLLIQKEKSKKGSWWFLGWLIPIIGLSSFFLIGFYSNMNIHSTALNDVNNQKNKESRINYSQVVSLPTSYDFQLEARSEKFFSQENHLSQNHSKILSNSSKGNVVPLSIFQDEISSVIDLEADHKEDEIEVRNVVNSEENRLVSTEIVENIALAESISVDSINKTELNEVENQLAEENFSSLNLKPKRSIGMYVALGAGVQSNFSFNNHSLTAGIIRFEYGFTKQFGRFVLSPSIGLESTFGRSYSFENIYVTYDLVRNDHQQIYNYNRTTNALLTLRGHFIVGASQRHEVGVMVSSAFNLYNNVVYEEYKNEEKIVRNEYFNQNLGLNRVFVLSGITYSYWLRDNLSLGVEVNSNFGTFGKKSFKVFQPSKANYQVFFNLKYRI